MKTIQTLARRSMAYPLQRPTNPSLEQLEQFREDSKVYSQALELKEQVEQQIVALKRDDQTRFDLNREHGAVVVQNGSRAYQRASELKYDPQLGTQSMVAACPVLPDSRVLKFARDGEILKYQSQFYNFSTRHLDRGTLTEVVLDTQRGTLSYSSSLVDGAQSESSTAGSALPKISSKPQLQERLLWSQPLVGRYLTSAQSADEVKNFEIASMRQREAQEALEKAGKLAERLHAMRGSKENMSPGIEGRVTVLDSKGGVSLWERLTAEVPPVTGELTFNPETGETIALRGYEEALFSPSLLELHRKEQATTVRSGPLEYRFDFANQQLTCVVHEPPQGN